MRELPPPRPEPATPTKQLLERSRPLREHSRALRQESHQLLAHFREICAQAGLPVSRPARSKEARRDKASPLPAPRSIARNPLGPAAGPSPG
jgi:hypothetical protein